MRVKLHIYGDDVTARCGKSVEDFSGFEIIVEEQFVHGGRVSEYDTEKGIGGVCVSCMMAFEEICEYR